MPFHLIEGGRYIVDILEKADLPVVIIFVRSSGKVLVCIYIISPVQCT